MASIKTILAKFESKTLPKEEWTHNAHIAVAFALIEKFKYLDLALQNLRVYIKEYNISVGTENNLNSGYHETMTVFWLKVVYEYYNSMDNLEIDEAYNTFTQTIFASAKFPYKFYSKELLLSIPARQFWIEPDLLPITEISEMIVNKMEYHFIMSDKEFEEKFENSTLEASVFTHEAHLRLAWIHISKYDEYNAILNITNQLKNYVNLLGATDKYNETLTVAAIKAVKHFMQKNHFDTFYEFIKSYPRLKSNFKDIIEQHYSFDIFNSEKAKEKYLEPDLLNFT